jgi:hypothetical protein
MAKKAPIDEDALKKQMMSGKAMLIPPLAQEPSEDATTSALAVATEAAECSARGQEQEDGKDSDVLHRMSKIPVKKQVSAEVDKDLARYEKLFLTRSILGLPRTNTGISMSTLERVEKVVNRLFDGRIAISTFIDNVITEHLMRNERSFNKWLVEKSTNPLFD